jgi:hypothetical protein
LTFKPAAAPKELPKGSLAFELSIARDAPAGRAAGTAKKPATKAMPPLKLHVIVTPESARTWIIVGGDKAQLAKTLLASTEAAPAAGKLGSRTDLGAMKDGKYVAASFTTMQSFLESFFGSAAKMSLDADAARTAAEARSMLESTPNRGKSPMLITGEVAMDNGVTWRARIDVPKGVIEDAIVLAASSRLMLPAPSP